MLLPESFEKTPQNKVESKAALKTFLFFLVIIFIINSLFVVLKRSVRARSGASIVIKIGKPIGARKFGYDVSVHPCRPLGKGRGDSVSKGKGIIYRHSVLLLEVCN